MDGLKAFISMLAGSVAAMAYPVFNPVRLLALLFIVDVAAGIISDRIVYGRGFSHRKFIRAVEFLALYVTIIGLMYITCYLLNDVNEGAVLLKAVTYVCVYFYFSNMAKNLHLSYPRNRFFSFLYFVLSLDTVTGRIPGLQKFLEREERDGADKVKGKSRGKGDGKERHGDEGGKD
jgi:hypothetical protein